MRDVLMEAFPTTRWLGITGRQEKLVYECLAQGGSYTLTNIGAFLLAADFICRETSISARIRDLNRRLRPNGFEIKWRYMRKGSTDTIYWLERNNASS